MNMPTQPGHYFALRKRTGKRVLINVIEGPSGLEVETFGWEDTQHMDNYSDWSGPVVEQAPAKMAEPIIVRAACDMGAAALECGAVEEELASPPAEAKAETPKPDFENWWNNCGGYLFLDDSKPAQPQKRAFAQCWKHCSNRWRAASEADLRVLEEWVREKAVLLHGLWHRPLGEPFETCKNKDCESARSVLRKEGK